MSRSGDERGNPPIKCLPFGFLALASTKLCLRQSTYKDTRSQMDLEKEQGYPEMP